MIMYVMRLTDAMASICGMDTDVPCNSTSNIKAWLLGTGCHPVTAAVWWIVCLHQRTDSAVDIHTGWIHQYD